MQKVVHPATIVVIVTRTQVLSWTRLTTQNNTLTLRKKMALTRPKGEFLPHSHTLLHRQLSSCFDDPSGQRCRNAHWKMNAGIATTTARAAFEVFREVLEIGETAIVPASQAEVDIIAIKMSIDESI